jgi:hypothetical protein
MKKTLSEKINNSARKIIRRWQIDNPDDSLLNMAQQFNLSGTYLKQVGAELEEKFKSDIRGKTTNELH